MEPKFQSSFIPKGPLATASTVTPTSRTARHSILGILANIVFTLAVLLGLAVFGYELYLNRNISKMGNDLTVARASLEPEVIEKISNLDERIISTAELLENHIVLSPLFDYLENSTLRTVRFTQFAYETTDKGLEVAMRGQARGYTAVALQSEIFNNSPYFKQPIFADLDLDEVGNVTFSFRANLDADIVSYKASADELEAAPAVVVPVTPQSPATSTGTSTRPNN